VLSADYGRTVVAHQVLYQYSAIAVAIASDASRRPYVLPHDQILAVYPEGQSPLLPQK